MLASHQSLINWYSQLAQHLEAGITIADAVELSGGPSQAQRVRMAESLRNGTTWSEAIQAADAWLPTADQRFLTLAESTSRMPQICQRLADQHRRVRDAKRAVVFSMIYPICVLHLAAFVLPFMKQLDFEAGLSAISPSAIIFQGITLLAPFWILAALILLMVKLESPVLPRLLNFIPLLRGYAKARALADFSITLGTYVEAGLSIRRGWSEAASASRSPEIQLANKQLAPIFEQGFDPANSISELPVFPQDFVAYYKTGVSTGSLDKSMLKLGMEYQGRANRALITASIVYPSLLFACVAALVIYTVFKFYAGYFDLLNSF